MLQQVMTKPGEIMFLEVPVPKPERDQVLVKIMNIGICGSDIHVYHGEHPFTSYPVTQGHEVSGQIVEAGSGRNSRQGTGTRRAGGGGGDRMCGFKKEKFQHACALANIDRLIQGLKGNEEELIEEGGNNLSMGQKQRVAIARALYGNPPVIVFDEPTANLDPDSVAAFKDMIRQIAEDKICIIVTHDMEVAAICDKVYELRDRSLYS